MRKLKLLIAGMMIMGCTGQAQALEATTTFAVTATVISTCIVAATPLAFGNYDASGADTDATNTVTVTCTSGTSYDVGLDAGVGSGATVATRKMTSGANTLDYTLYSNAGRTTVWGDTLGTDTVNATADVLPTAHTVYGRIPSGQYVPTGLYTDTINVTVTY